jgi:hypothetical protein
MKNKIIVPIIISGIIFLISSQCYAQLFPTKLKVTVINGLGNLVEDANVTVYATKEDYRSIQNPICMGKTNEKGKVKFVDIDPIIYFIDVRKGKQNNNGEGVQVGSLTKGRANKVNIVIE